jgi:hypothetical protein
MTEPDQVLYGRDLLPPPDERSIIPGKGMTEDIPTAEKITYLHYYCADGDWLIAELWPEGDGQWMAFGYAQPTRRHEDAKWTRITLREQEEALPRTGLEPVVKRDLNWTPGPFWRTRAEATLATSIIRLPSSTAAAEALAALPRHAADEQLTPASITEARRMILARFPHAADEPPTRGRHAQPVEGDQDVAAAWFVVVIRDPDGKLHGLSRRQPGPDGRPFAGPWGR